MNGRVGVLAVDPEPTLVLHRVQMGHGQDLGAAILEVVEVVPAVAEAMVNAVTLERVGLRLGSAAGAESARIERSPNPTPQRAIGHDGELGQQSHSRLTFFDSSMLASAGPTT